MASWFKSKAPKVEVPVEDALLAFMTLATAQFNANGAK